MKILSNIKISKWITLQILAFICISFAFSFLVIKDFSFPLTGWTGLGPWDGINYDYVDHHEYTGFYLAKNLSFNAFPQLNLSNNQVFYPYGTSSVFQPWSLEKDIFYAILYSFFGTGPWLQIYYLITVLITAVGTFALLLWDYGLARASGAGILVSFCNFYAINKYPHHFNISVIHWTTLGLIADFLIVKRVALRQHISLRLIVVRSCLLFLSFGQELGYIAGFALMSFTVSILFITALICYRYFRRELRLIELLRRERENYKNDFLAYPSTCLALLGLSLIAGYMYLPLVIQIAREAKSFDFTGINLGSFWTNPFRLLIPFFPIINNPGRSFQSVFRDSPEAIGAGSPGWFLLILGTVGLWQARRQIIIFIPLLIIFLLCLLYHPFLFPTLKIFPWFAFNRVGGRSTVIYPVILCIFALHINFNWLRSPRRRVLAGLLVFLACTELFTAYSFKLDYRPHSLDKSFLAYMDYVKKQPGEAVLDWPFCIVGSGADGICPYYRSTSGIFAMRRFHEKKVMGQYFGRLHPSQVEPYLQAGWDKLLFPDIIKPRQARCFRLAEWSFFTDFYKFNDFAGINLYVDRFPEDCVTEFYSRFGSPAIETLVPGAGRVKFIPKSPELRNQVNLALGTSLKWKPLLDLSESNLLQVNSPYGLTSTGLGKIEKDEQNGNSRWAKGTETGLSFNLSEPQPLELTFSFDNPIAFQGVAVEINGVTVETISNIKVGSGIKRNIKFQGVVGQNNIIFTYQKNRSFLVRIKKRFWKRNQRIQFRELSISAVE